MASGINRILVPVDGSKNSTRGLDEAIKLAQAVNASIIGLYVRHSSLPSVGAVTGVIRDNLKKEAESVMDAARRKTLAGGVTFREKISSGNAGETITRIADVNKYDIIVIGSRGLTGTKEAFLGSVANHVLHSAKTPVLVVK